MRLSTPHLDEKVGLLENFALSVPKSYIYRTARIVEN